MVRLETLFRELLDVPDRGISPHQVRYWESVLQIKSEVTWIKSSLHILLPMVTVSTLRPSGLVSDTVTTMSSILFVLTQCGCPARPQHKDQDASPLRWWVPQCKIIKCLVTFLD